ncbi:MAG TPA: ABC transporter ATP-binding protein [Candidatus Dormibacteraeota bacterium]|nr:ABC transporter ATP-binding protein [Candidatus Dormibacteraeota bacterium]
MTATSEPGAPAVILDAVVKRYGGATLALDHISLLCASGRFAVLLGASGSGKTTLLRCVAGIEKVTAGTIEIGGRKVSHDRLHLPPERRDLAMVFQDYALWPHMTTEQNIAFALRRLRLAPDTARQRTRTMLERVGLGQLGHRYPNELSGGEQQRVALARALVANTGLILFDEPLSNLDAHLRDRLRVEIATLVRECGATAIYITHDQAEAFALADDIGIMSRGRLIQMGTPEEIYLNPATSFVARFTGLAGELAVQVHGRTSGNKLQVRVGDRLVIARAPRPLKPGVPAQLLVRPSAGTLLASGDDRGDLLGVVRDVAFRGRGYEHVVDLAGGGRLHGLFSESKWGRAEQVAVKLDAEQCLLLDYEPELDPVEDPGARQPVVALAARVPSSSDEAIFEGIA